MFLLVPAHPGFPGQIPQSRKTVVCAVVYVTAMLQKLHHTEELCMELESQIADMEQIIRRQKEDVSKMTANE